MPNLKIGKLYKAIAISPPRKSVLIFRKGELLFNIPNESVVMFLGEELWDGQCYCYKILYCDILGLLDALTELEEIK